MPARFGDAIRRTGAGLASSTTALRTMGRHPVEVGEALALGWQLLAQGGVTVHTPPDPAMPMIRTTVQLDGDIVVAVSPDLFTLESGRWPELCEQHAAAVRKTLHPLTRLPSALRGMHALLYGIGTLAGGATAISIGSLPSAAGWVVFQAVMALLGAPMRQASLRLLRVGMRRRLQAMTQEWNAASSEAVAQLRARRA